MRLFGANQPGTAPDTDRSSRNLRSDQLQRPSHKEPADEQRPQVNLTVSPSSTSESASDQAIQQEIRQNRKFSLAAAIGQEAGDFLKGESPVPKLMQVKNELRNFVKVHLHDTAGALQAILLELIEADDAACSRHQATPLQALVEMLQPLLDQEAQLREFVWRVDMRWGQMYGERPHFELPGQPPHPDDEYTIESVRSQLQLLLQAVHQNS